MRFSVAIAVFVVGSITATEFQCWNFEQQDDIRQLYFSEVNRLRSELAQGKIENKDCKKCPEGSNIYRLEWDCILENLAQEAVNKCIDSPQLSDKAKEKLSMVYGKKKLTTCNPKPSFKEQMKNWWEVVKTEGLDDNLASKPGLESFATLANGRATRIGCAQRNCAGELHMACVVYDKAPANGQPIYEKGTPCADPSQCTTYKESKCQSSTKLCRAGYPTNETVAPQPPVDDTSSTSTTTTETATTTPAKSKYCEKQEGMNTDAARKLFLDEHNKYRAATAKGEVKMGNGANARKCPNMKKLTAYDCDLEKAAYETAKNCPSTDPNTNNENWFVAATGNSEKEAAEQAMKSWYAEIEKSYMEQKTGSQNLLLLTLKINHFARMVWGTNNRIGCAVHKCSDKWQAVCRYGPEVGTPGAQIYFMGLQECKQCSANCDNGLCTA
ncbi:hypothetical protein Y032_0009g462 [Ancylostoma ceylanicum]|uniref:SCP domain-containing protein n=1 Tax=Ancylostoma ceylanicum TaxID=53326 RepID=A0A016VH95_9BILA|nr:hypothetical protein Y032_0009g462 [Ancylostoma ceylanicum]